MNVTGERAQGKRGGGEQVLVSRERIRRGGRRRSVLTTTLVFGMASHKLRMKVHGTGAPSAWF
ncbi:MAG TPA: hypothetical protein VFX67_04725 [Burkholderiales bacterium]|nr:hypothetical protein [Burkholderiales bacterium]